MLLMTLSFLAAFIIASVSSLAGISGAFLLLPFQIGILGYAGPGVSATNQLFNVLACPSGIWKFWREGRLLLPLTILMAIGTLPGVLIGAIARATIFKETDRFLIFAALVLGYIGTRLIFAKSNKRLPAGRCKVTSFSLFEFSFEYSNSLYNVKSGKTIFISLVVGLIGGIYGIGGGGLIAPFLVSFFGLPVHAISGACLFTTFLTSVLGVLFYCLISPFFTDVALLPDWSLGCILGLGGLAGVYIGASLQKYLSDKILKILLGILQIAIAIIFIVKGLAI